MSNVPAVRDGVTQALAETGETLTIRRVTSERDPDAPSQPPVITESFYTCRGYVGPVSQWNPASMQREVTTDCYIDPLSLLNEDDEPVNTSGNLTVITVEGDVVIDDAGNEFILTREQHPRIEGVLALFWHRGIA